MVVANDMVVEELVVSVLMVCCEEWPACGCWKFVRFGGGCFESSADTLVEFASVAGSVGSTVPEGTKRDTLATEASVALLDASKLLVQLL